jgi:flagellar basal-body rod modification protein FlgD
MKLLVAQLKSQDPLQPTDTSAFVAQLSQMTMVQQSIAQSAKLDVLSSQMTGIASNATTDLVGKTVSIRGHGIAWDGTNATGAAVNLSGPATKVEVHIVDSNGKTVRTMQMGARPGGAMPVNWDGKDDNGQPAATGNYTVEVVATDKDGGTVQATQDVSGVVTKVSFAKGYPELQLESGATAPVSDLVSVGGTGR